MKVILFLIALGTSTSYAASSYFVQFRNFGQLDLVVSYTVSKINPTGMHYENRGMLKIPSGMTSNHETIAYDYGTYRLDIHTVRCGSNLEHSHYQSQHLAQVDLNTTQSSSAFTGEIACWE